MFARYLTAGTANDFAHAAGVPAQDPLAALQLAASAAPQLIDIGLLNDKPFVNLVSGGFGSRVTVETDPELKKRLGGLAYVLTGISRFASSRPTAAASVPTAFHGRGAPLPSLSAMAAEPAAACRFVRTRWSMTRLLDLTILPELERSARLDAFARLLREGAASIRADLVTARSAWRFRSVRKR